MTGEENLRSAIIDIEEELHDRVSWFREQGKLVEAQRLEQRTRYDLEMLREAGYCAGVENYSRHLQRREAHVAVRGRSSTTSPRTTSSLSMSRT